MKKFLVVEEPIEDRSVFYNFAVVGAEDSEEARSKYLSTIDVDLDKNALEILDIEDLDTDYYYYLEVDLEKVQL